MWQSDQTIKADIAKVSEGISHDHEEWQHVNECEQGD